MITASLYIKACSDKKYIRNKQKDFSYAGRKCYALINDGELSKKETEDSIKINFGLNDIEARSVYSEAKAKIDAHAEGIKDKLDKIKRTEKAIEKLFKAENKTQKQKESLFKLRRKLAFLVKSIAKGETFGKKSVLQKISYFSNFIGQTITHKNGTKINADRKLKTLKNEYHENRINPIYLLGEANQGGNRFFDFDFENKTITYKPQRGTKITISYACADSYQKQLLALQPFIDTDMASVTVTMTDGYINLTFDDSIISGYNLLVNERAAEVKKIEEGLSPKERKETVNAIYVKYHRELDGKRLKNKLPGRVMAYDDNPNFIGVCIRDEGEDNKIVFAWYYDLTHLNEKLPKNATKAERKKMENKRDHGIKHIWKDIFATANYFKVGRFFAENLNFKEKVLKDDAKEANRQTHNIWHRKLSRELINKYCNRQGIILKDDINAAYSSTIGNLLYSFVDCVNAAIEIARRGLSILTGEGFYPPLLQENFTYAMTRLNALNPAKPGDVMLLNNCNNWIEIHQSIKKTGIRYRASLGDVCLAGGGDEPLYHSSTKLKHSLIKKIIFN